MYIKRNVKYVLQNMVIHCIQGKCCRNSKQFLSAMSFWALDFHIAILHTIIFLSTSIYRVLITLEQFSFSRHCKILPKIADLLHITIHCYICNITIHKNDVCLSQKYPETWNCLPNPIFFTKYEYGFTFWIEATASKWPPFFILSDFCSAAAG